MPQVLQVMQVLQRLWVLWSRRGETHLWQWLQRACEQGQGLELCPCLPLYPSISGCAWSVAVPAVCWGWEQLSVVSAAWRGPALSCTRICHQPVISGLNDTLHCPVPLPPARAPTGQQGEGCGPCLHPGVPAPTPGSFLPWLFFLPVPFTSGMGEFT